MSENIITIDSEKLYFIGGVELQNPHRVCIPQGLSVVIGPNGSGKSTLGNILERGWNFRTNRLSSPSGKKPRVKKIQFTDIHSLAGDSVVYYQQRYEATMNDSVPTVGEILGQEMQHPHWQELASLFGLHGLEDRKVNYLSSGQLRKFLIVNALLSDVDLLILDNPYIGLDAPSRDVLNEAMAKLPQTGVNIMLLIANERDLPTSASCVIPMANMIIGQAMNLQDYKGLQDNKGPQDNKGLQEATSSVGVPSASAEVPLPFPPKPHADTAPIATIMHMRNCTVRHGGRVLLENVNWLVRDGECWSLSGPNGSGKSTLLSLACADNPQAYCNDITLFDRRRGTGESIWDIKRRISYISPEASLHFHPQGSTQRIIAQGLAQTACEPLKPKQLDLTLQWMQLLGIEHLKDRPFGSLSTGERQLALLCRVFAKQPRLMILDEPFHGLDAHNTALAKAIIEQFAERAKANPERHPMSLIIVSHYAQELPPCITHHKSLASQSA